MMMKVDIIHYKFDELQLKKKKENASTKNTQKKQSRKKQKETKRELNKTTFNITL